MLKSIPILLLLSLATHARPWTNTNGKKIEADFISLDGDKITLSIKDKEYTLPLASLSQADQQFAKEEQKRIENENEKLLTGPWSFGGITLAAGEQKTALLDISEENQKIAENGGKGWIMDWSKNYPNSWFTEIFKTHPVTKVNTLIVLPDEFNPTKPTPIFIQWTSSDSKNNINGASAYSDACKKNGVILISVDATPDPKAAWSTPVFLANINTALKEVYKTWPATKQSPIVVGGFSGGAKISQWMAPLIGQAGHNVKGIYIGGCNEALFEYAMRDYNIKGKDLRKLKLYASSGTNDPLVNDAYREILMKGMKDTGAIYRNETYEGGHSIDQAQLVEAIQWILADTP